MNTQLKPTTLHRPAEAGYLDVVLDTIEQAAITPVPRPISRPPRYVDDVIAMIDDALASSNASPADLDELAS